MPLSASVSSCHLSHLHVLTQPCLSFWMVPFWGGVFRGSILTYPPAPLTYQARRGATWSREPSCQRQGLPATSHGCHVLGECWSGWEDVDRCQQLVLGSGVGVYVIVVAEEALGGYFGQRAAGRCPPNPDSAAGWTCEVRGKQVRGAGFPGGRSPGEWPCSCCIQGRGGGQGRAGGGLPWRGASGGLPMLMNEGGAGPTDLLLGRFQGRAAADSAPGSGAPPRAALLTVTGHPGLPRVRPLAVPAALAGLEAKRPVRYGGHPGF